MTPYGVPPTPASSTVYNNMPPPPPPGWQPHPPYSGDGYPAHDDYGDYPNEEPFDDYEDEVSKNTW